MSSDQLKILCVDDNKDMVETIVAMLTKAGFLVYSASTPAIAISIAQKLAPDLILLDIMMPGMSGYDVCKTLQQNEQTAGIPVVFISALNQPQNKVSALAAGGVDYLTKPFDKDTLVAVTRRYAGKKTAAVPAPQPARPPQPAGSRGHYKFSEFQINIIGIFKLEGAAAKAVTALQPGDVYKLPGILGVSSSRVARLIATFARRPYLPLINPDDVKQGVLPVKFAVQNNIAAVSVPGGGALLAMGHPFNFELHEMIRGLLGGDFDFAVTEPANISVLYRMTEEQSSELQKIPGDMGMAIEEAALNRLRTAAKSTRNEINEPHVKYLTGKLVQFLAAESNFEVRIEAQGASYLVRAGQPKALAEYARFSRMTGNMVIARLKALGGMDAVERNLPQTGAFSVACSSGTRRLALSTAAADFGENLILNSAVQ